MNFPQDLKAINYKLLLIDALNLLVNDWTIICSMLWKHVCICLVEDIYELIICIRVSNFCRLNFEGQG